MKIYKRKVLSVHWKRVHNAIIMVCPQSFGIDIRVEG